MLAMNNVVCNYLLTSDFEDLIFFNSKDFLHQRSTVSFVHEMRYNQVFIYLVC